MTAERPTRVLLYSGGQDSWCARHLWQPDVVLYADMGSRYADAELARVAAEPGVTVVQLPLGQWERPDAIIPLRNLLLVGLAAQYGGNDGHVQVAMGATAGDRTLDKSPEFAARAGDLLSWLWGPQWWTAGKRVEVVLPWKDRTKAELVADYLAAGGSAAELQARSFSCYTPRHRPNGRGGATAEHCGACKACARRWIAFAANGVPSTPDCRQYVVDHLLPGLADGTTSRGTEDDDLMRALELTA